MEGKDDRGMTADEREKKEGKRRKKEERMIEMKIEKEEMERKEGRKR